MRFCIYCRLSRNPDGTTLSIATQEADGRAYVERLGGVVAAVFVDDDISAHDEATLRAGFEQLIQSVIAGDVDAVVARDQARYARNPISLRRISAACLRSNVELHTVDQGRIAFDTPEGKAMSGVMNVFDELYVDKIKVLTKRTMEERARRGLKLNGLVAFGYRKADTEDTYEIVDEEAAEIRDAAARVIAGASLRSIAAEWNARGLTGRKGKPWDAGGVRRVLVAPRTAGLRVHRGAIVGPATWPPILDERTWKKVGAVLAAPSRRTSVSQEAKLLTGVLSCGVCQRTLNSERAGGANTPRIYACRHCRRTSVRAEPIEKYVVELILGKVEERSVRAELERAPDVEPLYEELDDIKGRMIHLARMFGEGMDRDEFDAARAPLERRKRAIEREIQEVEQPSPVDWSTTSDVAADWEAMTSTEKRAVVRGMFRVLEIRPQVHGGTFDRSRVRYEFV